MPEALPHHLGLKGPDGHAERPGRLAAIYPVARTPTAHFTDGTALLKCLICC